MNTALMPLPKQQFFNANGLPLAGGFVFTYAAGTTTPLATYQDANGSAANTNPVVLDAGGFANIWLAAATYKIVVQDSDGVQVYSQDNVSAVSLAELQENTSFASLAVSGDVSIGGDLTVDGKITAATGEFTGTLTLDGALVAAAGTVSGDLVVNGALSAASASVTGAESVGGTLGVTGDTTLAGALTVAGATTLNGAVNIGAQTLAAYILAAVTALAGTLVVSSVATSGNFVVITFGTSAGTRVRLAIGFGSGATNGSSIALPSGFVVGDMLAGAWVASLATTPGNQLNNFSVSVTAGVISVAASDNSGHNFTPTAGWAAVAWQLGF